MRGRSLKKGLCNSKRRSGQSHGGVSPPAVGERSRNDSGTLQSGVTVALHDPLNQLQYLRSTLTAHGVAVIDGSAAATDGKAVWVSSVLDDATKARLSQGGTVVLLAGSRDALPAGGTLTILPRAGSDLTGDWVSNFNWALSSSLKSGSPFLR